MKALLLRLSRNEAGPMLFAFTASMLVLRLTGNVVLTRMLDPYAFGVVGVIISVMMVLAMLSDLGVVDFVVRHKRGSDRSFLDVIWTVRLAQSVLQSLAMLAAAWPIAIFLGKPELALPIALTAPLFIVNACCPMGLLLAQRDGRVRRTSMIELGALAIQISCNLGLILIMPDYRALLIGLYVGAVARVVLTIAMIDGRSRLSWNRALVREFLGFSRWIMASTLLTLLITQSDKFIFARLFSVADFGVYILPVNLALSLQPFGRNYVDRYFFPLVSRCWRETPERLSTVFYDARRRFCLLMFGAIGVAIGGAPALFGLMFDHRYEYGWIYLSVLLFRVALDIDNFATIKTLVAMGHSRLTFRVNLVRFAFFASGVVLLFGPLGPLAFVVALAASELAAMVYCAVLLRTAALLRLREHAFYHLMLLGGVVLGAVFSLLLARSVIGAGLALIG